MLEPTAAPPSGPTPPPPAPSTGRTLAVAVALLALIGGGWLLIRELLRMTELQNCVMSGRRNCAPVDTASVSP